MAEIIKVGIADMNVVTEPDTITTIGLGSCVGIALWDRMNHIGGLVHVMLPDSTQVKSNSNLAKFADTGIPELVKAMESRGARKSNMIAKIAGGAQMFAFQNKSELMGVGERNVAATKAALSKLGIAIVSEDVGNNYGRTVVLNPANGNYEVKAVGKELKII